MLITVIDTRRRSQIISSNKHNLYNKDEKDLILKELEKFFSEFLDNAKNNSDFRNRKLILHKLIIGVQNAVNNQGMAYTSINDSRNYLTDLTSSKSGPNSVFSKLEKLAVHRNALFGDWKLNFFGEANFTEHISKLMDMLNNKNRHK